MNINVTRDLQRLGYSSISCEFDSAQIIQDVNSLSTVLELYGITADVSSMVTSFVLSLFAGAIVCVTVLLIG
ncbi:hypothetical protein YC2023_109392 [Brassica napus]